MKKCPKCGLMNEDDAAKCKGHLAMNNRVCMHQFTNNCKGCGRDVRGREYCRECVTPGVCHWQRNER